MRTAWMAGLLVLAVTAADAAAQARSEVPIRLVTLANGDRRFAVPLKMGSTEIEAGLDTGSTGLRILPGTLQPADARGSGDSDHYAYGSGTEFLGETGKGVLTLGGASGTVSLQLIHDKDCLDRIPNCPASRIPMAQFGIQGDGIPSAGFKAIFGINMAVAEIDNPLSAIGVTRWIIELPRTESETGKLVLNPSDDEVKAYAMVPVLETYRYQQGGLHDAVSGCIANQASKASACGALLMDTGAPGINLVNGGMGAIWPDNTPALLSFYDGRAPRAAESFTTGLRAHASRLSFTQQDGSRDAVIYAGLSPYFAFDVLYDPASHAIGLKPRPQEVSYPAGALIPR